MTAGPAIVFRADASHATGLGHVARLTAVIEELAATGVRPIAMFGGDDAVAAWTRHRGIAGEVKPWTVDQLVAAAGAPEVRAVVLDGPGLVTAAAPALIARGIRAVVIDDRGDMPLAADAVINHNFHAPALAASYPAARLCLLGRRYLMLRRDIRRYPRGACRPRTGARPRIVVSFGGSDPIGATIRTLQLFPPERPSDLRVLAGPGFRDATELQRAAAAATAAGHTVDLVRDPDDPASVFVHADAAICAAGGTLGELAYLGCPALGFAIVSDQIATAHCQRRSRLIAGGQSWPMLDDAALRAELLGFVLDDRGRLDHRDHALATADGGGAQRIVTEALG